MPELIYKCRDFVAYDDDDDNRLIDSLSSLVFKDCEELLRLSFRFLSAEKVGKRHDGDGAQPETQRNWITSDDLFKGYISGMNV
jgi:hypothetical protein